MTSSKIKEKNVIFKKLSCWYWENVALYGWAGIPANGQGLFCAKWIYTVRSAGERGGQRAEKFLCVNFAHLAIKCEFYFTEESAQVVQRLHFKTDKERGRKSRFPGVLFPTANSSFLQHGKREGARNREGRFSTLWAKKHCEIFSNFEKKFYSSCKRNETACLIIFSDQNLLK